jgi:uncharacterized damage-inducible protein DinB
MTKPDFESIPPFYWGYLENVKHLDVYEALRKSGEDAYKIILTVPEDKGALRYAEGKWSIKELLCHMMDVERIMAYRALRFARRDKTPLPGFEENDYAPNANADARTIVALAEEMKALRKSTLDLFNSFSPDMLQQTGTANKSNLSVLNLGYIIPGHETHHVNILKDRYLKV